MTSPAFPLRLFAAVVLLATGLAAPAAADYMDDYKAGLDAMERQDWQTAVRSFESAIAGRPDAAGLLSGPLLRRYTPHFYLGISLARLGRCREAIAALDEAERQGKVKEVDVLARERQSCRDRVQEMTTQVGRQQSTVDRAANEAAAVALLQSSPMMAPVWDAGSPSFAERQRRALGQLAQARDALRIADQDLDPDALERGEDLAAQSLDSLAGLRQEAEGQRERRRQRSQEVFDEVTRQRDAAQRDLRFVASLLRPYPADVARAVEDLEEVVSAVDTADAMTPPEELDRYLEAVTAALATLRREVKAPPQRLIDAAGAYLRGDPERALELLVGARWPDARSRAHACILEVASLHLRDRLAGLESAEAGAKAATCSLRPDAQPVPWALPPEVVELLRRTAPPPAGG